MAKKQFKAESKRLLDLMIHSIYTHKEIFLRELLSNASDAVDKLAYRALTDDQVNMTRDDFEIRITADRDARTLTVSDNGIGMTREELEENLGTIARSGSFQFKKDLSEADASPEPLDIIGQFGVGFYSAFMVADEVTVVSRAYGAEQAYAWRSTGADGYTITECSRDGVGTDVIMKLKPDTDDEQYSSYLDGAVIQRLVHKYSDYIRTPIRMELERRQPKPLPEDAPKDAQPEWETITELTTLNSRVPLWQRSKGEITSEETDRFYQEKFGDFQPPLATIQISAEGTVTYKGLLYIPMQAPYDFYTRDFQKGLQLYSSGVMIMEHCEDLVPEHFRFVRGVIDSPDFSLNISREMLQHTRQLKIICNNLEKKIKSELLRLLEQDREKYETFFTSFGRQLKYGTVAEYGAHKELLRDLLLFSSTGSEKPTTLAEYVKRMPEEQKFLYYASGETVEQIRKLPQAERILAKGYEILCLTQQEDEFVLQALGEQDGKQMRSIDADDALPETDEERTQNEQQAQEQKDLLDFVKETLKDQIQDARLSTKLISHPVCLTAEGPITLEMEKYFRSLHGAQQAPKAARVLELNPSSNAFAALRRAFESDREQAATYAKILYQQALLIAGLPLEDPAGYTDLVCSLMR